MLLRSFVTLALVVLQLAACNQQDPHHKAAIDEMDRRHTEQIERLGGGGGGGGSGM